MRDFYTQFDMGKVVVIANNVCLILRVGCDKLCYAVIIAENL